MGVGRRGGVLGEGEEKRWLSGVGRNKKGSWSLNGFGEIESFMRMTLMETYERRPAGRWTHRRRRRRNRRRRTPRKLQCD